MGFLTTIIRKNIKFNLLRYFRITNVTNHYYGKFGFKNFCSNQIENNKPNNQGANSWNLNDFKKTCDSTLEDLYDYLEELGDPFILDVSYADGILNIQCKNDKVFILNRQTPNRQIWFSSPYSGPQRFNYDKKSQKWLNSNNEAINEVINHDIEKLKGM